MGAARGQSFSEGFTSVPMLTGAGWVLKNQSSPIGPLNQPGWFQGNPAPLTAHLGVANSYLASNFNATETGGTISAWAISPVRTLRNGDVIRFYTSTEPGEVFFPDRLQLRLSMAGASSDTGSSATDVGDFSQLLIDINETYSTAPFPEGYPTEWTQFSYALSGLAGPTAGRFAFRYFVEDGGSNGSRSNYIGIDTLDYIAVPEPASAVLLVAGTFLFAPRRRRRIPS